MVPQAPCYLTTFHQRRKRKRKEDSSRNLSITHSRGRKQVTESPCFICTDTGTSFYSQHNGGEKSQLSSQEFLSTLWLRPSRVGERSEAHREQQTLFTLEHTVRQRARIRICRIQNLLLLPSSPPLKNPQNHPSPRMVHRALGWLLTWMWRQNLNPDTVFQKNGAKMSMAIPSLLQTNQADYTSSSDIHISWARVACTGFALWWNHSKEIKLCNWVLLDTTEMQNFFLIFFCKWMNRKSFSSKPDMAWISANLWREHWQLIFQFLRGGRRKGADLMISPNL